MFKVKYNDVVREHNTLLEAKKDALLSFKKDTSIKLVEVLEDDIVVFDKQREEPTPIQVENAVDSEIRARISRVWDNINDYESLLVTLNSENIIDDSIDEKINDIIDDLHTHLGILESCLSDYPNKEEETNNE